MRRPNRLPLQAVGRRGQESHWPRAEWPDMGRITIFGERPNPAMSANDLSTKKPMSRESSLAAMPCWPLSGLVSGLAVASLGHPVAEGAASGLSLFDVGGLAARCDSQMDMGRGRLGILHGTAAADFAARSEIVVVKDP